MKKKFICVFLAVMVIMSTAAVSFAAEAKAAAITAETDDFNLRITYPSAGSLKKTGRVMSAGGLSPWVRTTVTTIATRYWLIPAGGAVTALAANTISVTDAGRYSFRYNSNYGGAYTYYQMAMGTLVEEYDPYYVRGTWSPD